MKRARVNLLMMVGVLVLSLAVFAAFGCGDETDTATGKDTTNTVEEKVDGSEDGVTSDTSDSGGSNAANAEDSPSDVVDQYYQAAFAADCAAAYSLYYYDPSKPEEVQMHEYMIQECSADTEEPLQGSYEITDEQISGDTATVAVSYNDSSTGQSGVVTFNMIRVDGKWYIDNMGRA